MVGELASQPTISRFENQVGVQALYAMGCELATSVTTNDPEHPTRPQDRASLQRADSARGAFPQHGWPRVPLSAMEDARARSEASGQTDVAHIVSYAHDGRIIRGRAVSGYRSRVRHLRGLRAARTGCARAQVTWLRDRLLKLGAHVVVSVRRIILHLPTATADLYAWRRIALALGARPGS